MEGSIAVKLTDSSPKKGNVLMDSSKQPRVSLTLYQPNLAPSRLSIDEETITMGRSAECTIPIKDRYLSRRHAELCWTGSEWLLRDHGSANGTFVNGNRVDKQLRVRPGDRISLGDSEIVIETEAAASTPSISLADTSTGASMWLPAHDIDSREVTAGGGADRLQIVNTLAMELLEDRPLAELFDFIIERVMALMAPSRAALALLAPDRTSFVTVKLRCRDQSDSADLTISRTLLREVVEERKVLAFTDVAEDANLAQAKSIIGQSIRSALCAPLLVGDSVLGVLYVDYLLSQRNISRDDVRLAGQIARVAAIKLETTRLREEALVKQKMDEELKTAYEVQSRLLPAAPPECPGYEFAGLNRPCRTVSGDYYDFVVRPDGRVYFVIADVSGKGITAALVMASLATAFNIFARKDPSPAELVRELNETLAPKTAPRKFVTLFAGLLDPTEGKVEFANAGHTPPLWLQESGVTTLKETDMVVGLFTQAVYRNQTVQLAHGDSLLLFTDGVIEAENEEGAEMGSAAVEEKTSTFRPYDAATLIRKLEECVLEFAGPTPMTDDVTILSLRRQ